MTPDSVVWAPLPAPAACRWSRCWRGLMQNAGSGPDGSWVGQSRLAWWNPPMWPLNLWPFCLLLRDSFPSCWAALSSLGVRAFVLSYCILFCLFLVDVSQRPVVLWSKNRGRVDLGESGDRGGLEVLREEKMWARMYYLREESIFNRINWRGIKS